MEAIIGVQVRRKDTLSREYLCRKCCFLLLTPDISVCVSQLHFYHFFYLPVNSCGFTTRLVKIFASFFIITTEDSQYYQLPIVLVTVTSVARN